MTAEEVTSFKRDLVAGWAEDDTATDDVGILSEQLDQILALEPLERLRTLETWYANRGKRP